MNIKLESGHLIEAKLRVVGDGYSQANPILHGRAATQGQTVAQVVEAVRALRPLDVDHAIQRCIIIDPRDAEAAAHAELLWRYGPGRSQVGYLRGDGGPTTDDFEVWLAEVRRRLLPFATPAERLEARVVAQEARILSLEKKVAALGAGVD